MCVGVCVCEGFMAPPLGVYNTHMHTIVRRVDTNMHPAGVDRELNQVTSDPQVV